MHAPKTYRLSLMEDLYAILGTTRSASTDDIKSAYRKLARKLHPDVNKAPDAQQQFARVQQAYEILSDDTKRARYDRTGRIDADPFTANRNPGGHPGGGFHGVDTDDIGEMFNTFFRDRGQQTRRPPTPPRNLDIRAPLTLDLETIASGGVVKARTPSGNVVEVTVPPAVATGATLRVKGQGNSDSATGRKGDLLLEIRAKQHPTITRGRPNAPDPAGLDLTTRADISIATATLGGRIPVERLGESLSLTIPKATPSGRSLRLRGKGLTNAAGKSGDLYIELRIVPPDPDTLDEDQRDMLRSIPDPTDRNQTQNAEPDSGTTT